MARFGYGDVWTWTALDAESKLIVLYMIGSRDLGTATEFSKKIENHCHAIALHFMHYNFCRIHKTLRVTPAMEAGLAKHQWSAADLLALLG